PAAEKGQKAPARRSGLSYKDKREYEGLPARIAALEAEIARQEKALADPTLYGRDPDRFHKLAGALDAARAELAAAEERWLEL
uniref:ABC transporter C-terminal domain-containing protein n=1 Tax=Klebsiella pneumoniae TaxID=573 RepID=UPI0022285B14